MTRGRQILVITPLVSEFEPLLDVLARGESGEPLSGPVPGVFLSHRNTILARGGHGKATFAARTAWLLATTPSIGTVIIIGSAGSLDPRAAPPLSVVIGTDTVEHDYHERFDPHPSLPVHTADRALCNQIYRAASTAHEGMSPAPILRRGIIASGDEDIVDRERAREVASITGGICVAWEGAGGARAARLAGVPWCEMRAISDHANSSAPEDFRAQLQRAMKQAAGILDRWLS